MSKRIEFRVRDGVDALVAARSALESLDYTIEQSGTNGLTAWESTSVTGPDPARLSGGDPRGKGSQFLGLELAVVGPTLTMTSLTTGRTGGFVGTNRISSSFRRAKRAINDAVNDV